MLKSNNEEWKADQFMGQKDKAREVAEKLTATSGINDDRVWSDSSRRILAERYLNKDAKGEIIEDPNGMCGRVARAVAEAERKWASLNVPKLPVMPSRGDDAVNVWAVNFYEVMASKKFMPNSPTIMNAGKDNGMQLSACFVLPVEDSLPEIFDSIKYGAIIHQTGGGCLRKGALVPTMRGLLPIEKVATGDEVFSLSQETNTSVKAKVLQTHIYEVPDAYRVILSGGRTLTTSPWHPFMVFDGTSVVEKRADELSLSDYVMVPSAVPPRWADQTPLQWLVGFFIGDGHFNHHSSGMITVAFSVNSAEERAAVNECIREHFDKQYVVDYSGTVPLIRLQSPRETTFFVELFGDTHDKLRIPEGYDTPITIAGLFDADASCVSGRIQLETISKTLASQVACLLNLWGINTVVYKHTSGLKSRFGSTIGYRVSVNSRESFERFREIVGVYLKRLKLTDHDVKWSNRSSNVSAKLPHVNDGTTHIYRWEKGLDRISASTACRVLVDASARNAVANSFRVESIEQVAGGSDFYDLTVEGHETYAAGENGLMFVHNTGYSLSRLRPRGSRVKKTNGTSSGPVSFLKIFNAATEQIKQGGSRRGANMAILRVDHPDIREFITCKLPDPKTGVRDVTNFNISVAVTDKFWEALEGKGESSLQDPVISGFYYDLVAPHTGEVVRREDAREIFDLICKCAWETGDPGLFFIDRANRSASNPIPDIELIESTNPCGEQCLGPYDACNLGSINLAKMVKPAVRGLSHDLKFGSDSSYEIDWEELERVTRITTRFLDNVVEINPLPLPQIQATVKSNRRIGLGVMGWADLLFLLKIPYNNQSALELGERLMKFVTDISHDESRLLAEVRGAFPNFIRSIYKEGAPIRNGTCTTVAPTGSISIIADCSSGIEPAFALAFTHVVERGTPTERRLIMVNPIFERMAKEDGFWSKELEDYVAEKGSIKGWNDFAGDVNHSKFGRAYDGNHLALVSSWVERVFVCAHEVTPQVHVQMQAAFQRGVDNAISKTVNLPNSATPEEISQIYRMANDLNCKGITIFRDGCLATGQVLNVGTSKGEGSGLGSGDVGGPSIAVGNMVNSALQPELVSVTALLIPDDVGGAKKLPLVKSLPAEISGKTIRVEAPEGTAHVTINSDEDGPAEVFVAVGRAGSDITALAEAIGRLISFSLRLASPMSQLERLGQIQRQLDNIGGSRSKGFGPHKILSVPHAIAHAIGKFTERATLETKYGIEGVKEIERVLTNPDKQAPLEKNGQQESLEALKEGLKGLKPQDNACPMCMNFGTYVKEEGCSKCHSCGYSEC